MVEIFSSLATSTSRISVLFFVIIEKSCPQLDTYQQLSLCDLIRQELKLFYINVMLLKREKDGTDKNIKLTAIYTQKHWNIIEPFVNWWRNGHAVYRHEVFKIFCTICMFESRWKEKYRSMNNTKYRKGKLLPKIEEISEGNACVPFLRRSLQSLVRALSFPKFCMFEC